MRKLIVLLSFILMNPVYANKDLPAMVIEKIESGVYLHKSFSHVKGFGLVSSNGLVVFIKDEAYIVDTPWSESDTQKLVQWIENKNINLVASLSTHSHEDRTAGIKWLNSQSVTTYASILTNQILSKNGKDLASATIESKNNTFFEGEIETFYPGAGHAIDNIVVWLPKSRILFGGCLVKSLASKTLGYTGDASIGQWSDSVDKAGLKYPNVQFVIPGHGQYGGVELLEHTKELVEKESNVLDKNI